MFVVYYCEHMGDGQEEGAKIVGTIEEALSIIDRIGNGFCGSNNSFRLFKLGEEIPLKVEVVREPKPVEVVERRRFTVAQANTDSVRKSGRRRP